MFLKRKLLIALFTFGTVAGFGSGIASLACHAGRHHAARRAAFEAHVADICVDAAMRRDGQVPPGRHPHADAPHGHGPRYGYWR